MRKEINREAEEGPISFTSAMVSGPWSEEEDDDQNDAHHHRDREKPKGFVAWGMGLVLP